MISNYNTFLITYFDFFFLSLKKKRLVTNYITKLISMLQMLFFSFFIYLFLN